MTTAGPSVGRSKRSGRTAATPRASAPADVRPDAEIVGRRLADLVEGGRVCDRVVLVAAPEEKAARVLAGVAEVEARYGLVLADELALASFTGRAGEVVDLPVAAPGDPVERVLVVGAGEPDARGLRRAGAAAARRLRGARAPLAVLGDLDPEQSAGFVEGFLLGAYTFSRRSRPSQPAETPVRSVLLLLDRPARHERAVTRAVTTARAVYLARDLANTPASEKDPAWLADAAARVAAESGLTVRIRDEVALRAEGFGGILGVGMGSVRPPRLIELGYAPAEAGPRTPHVVLVGKGITFDSGGLSLKRPYEAMVAMKTDMAAGGAVIALMGALRELAVPVRVTGLVAAAENLPGGSAQRPGDVITHYGGRTSEVLNTDAEGRLVLADALAYADARLDPDVLVDLATLTGAATRGLGKRHAALYTADDRLAEAFSTAGQASGDRVWRMPLVEDYRPALDSMVADVAHVSTDPHVGGGSIVAALFLREFVGARRWVHLDIAGPARAESDEHEVTKGATGYGVRLLLRWLAQPGRSLRAGSVRRA